MRKERWWRDSLGYLCTYPPRSMTVSQPLGEGDPAYEAFIRRQVPVVKTQDQAARGTAEVSEAEAMGRGEDPFEDRFLEEGVEG